MGLQNQVQPIRYVFVSRYLCFLLFSRNSRVSSLFLQSAIFNVVAEVLLCLKDSNAKTREAAYQLLNAMASLGGIGKLLQSVTAALGAETPHMRSAAVMALSRIIFEFGWENEQLQPLLPSLLTTVLVLIDENSREVIKSVIGFIRISVAAIPSEHLQPLLPDLIDGLMRHHKAKDRFRAKIKIILKKLVRLFGYDALLPFVPESETRLLTHMRKLDERQKRRKAALRAEGRPDLADFEGMVDSDEDDSDDGRTLMTGATGFSRMTGRSATPSKAGGASKAGGDKSAASRASRTIGGSSVATGKSTRKSEAALRLPDETDGEVVDMLSSGVRKRVKFADDNMDDSDSDDGAMEFDDDGRLVVKDDMDEGATKPDANTDPDSMSATDGRRTSKFEAEKAKRAEGMKKQAGKRGRDLGSSYKSKKAGGDVQRKGQKFEPYAYVPLDGRSYSKKNRRAAVDQMSSVVRQGGKRKKN
jgi:ribosomal RNA-processing protein 12